jgi:coenzyme F420-dependent glucose-6-phosphate dehydrogenase
MAQLQTVLTQSKSRMVGFHCSHELYSPKELLELAHLAIRSGFSSASCSDHIHPWSADGQSGFAWSWLGAALERCGCEFGTVCAPGQRYHPAIIAQASATLAQMYPGQFWVALGTGENVNEHITGDTWPAKEIRQQRLQECVDVIRRLWEGETVSHRGLVTIDRAKLYTRPERSPLIFGAAISDATAEWVGSWADGLLTVAKPPNDLTKTVEAFHRGGGKGKPMRLQSAVALDTSEKILEAAVYRRWGVGCLQVGELQDIATPEEFDRRIARHTPAEVCENLRVSTDLDEHREWIRQDLELGFESVYLHYVGRNIRQFIDVFSREVLPKIG